MLRSIVKRKSLRGILNRTLHTLSSKPLSDGVWIEEIEGNAIKEFEANQKYFKNGFVRFQPSGHVFPSEFALVEKQVTEFSVREDDIWLSSFPTCGMTWTQEMVWNIVNNVDLDTAKKIYLDSRVPYVELSGVLTDGGFEEHLRVFGEKEKESVKSSIEFANEMPSPRILRTHLSADMLPREVMKKNAKLIYVARNPRDTCVSLYHHWMMMTGYSGWKTFFNAFLEDVCGYYTPFMQHVLSYWKFKDNPNILFLTYEEMKKDLPSVIRKTAAFLEKTLTDEQIEILTEHLLFRNMKKNKAVNKVAFFAIQRKAIHRRASGSEFGDFMRVGETGNWRIHLSENEVERIKTWEDKHLKGTGLQFVNDI